MPSKALRGRSAEQYRPSHRRASPSAVKVQDAVKRTSPTAVVATLLVALVTLLSGCGAGGEGADAPGALEGSWTLDVVGGASADPAVASTLTMEDGSASGNAGVNTFNGSYDAPDDGVLTFGPLATTMMAGPDNAMQQEQAFLQALAATTTFTTKDSTLELMDEGGKTLAVLERAGEG